MRLIEHHHIVRLQISIPEHLCEQGTVGGVLEASRSTRTVVETDGVTDKTAELNASFGGNAGCERGGSDSSRLGTDDTRCFAGNGGAQEKVGDFFKGDG
jgi:hypothetical protein